MRLTAHLRTLTFAILLVPFEGLAAQTLVPPVVVGPSKIFAGPPQLLQESGAGEGPAWHPELGLLTSGDGDIHQRDKQGKSSIYRSNAGSNGLLFDRQGRLVICEPVRRRVTRLELNGDLTVLAETFNGKKFNQPNDLALDSKDRIYFSDPRYGARDDMQILDEAGRTIEGVYRIDPDGHVTRVLGREVERANGLIVTADDKYLFVADNNNSQGGARKLYRFELNTDGTLKLDSQKLIYDWGTTRGPDGMKLDIAGNLYVAAGLNKLIYRTRPPSTPQPVFTFFHPQANRLISHRSLAMKPPTVDLAARISKLCLSPLAVAFGVFAHTTLESHSLRNWLRLFRVACSEDQFQADFQRMSGSREAFHQSKRLRLRGIHLRLGDAACQWIPADSPPGITHTLTPAVDTAG